ncbi:MAG: DUF4921 family protein [Candidatus Yanofskybacteria bacterium]|nr:DUF4921 family protein [Candidatus Yanofskybacteria bacterium]
MALSEFRKDLVSGEWVLFSTGRKRRPHQSNSKDQLSSPTECPFDDLKKTGQEIVWNYPEGSEEITVIKNKFPAVKPGLCAPLFNIGPFEAHEGSGTHDVFVYKDHNKLFADFSEPEFVNVIRAYKKRYLEILQLEDCAQYVLLFHNYGSDAGASIMHPHSQVLSTPILPPDVSRSLHGAKNFFQANQKRVYDLMIAWEKEQKKRIVYENDFFVAFCPFVSKYPYEIRIFAKDGHAHFEKMPDALDPHLANALSVVLKKTSKALDNPSFNFFIHTAPVESSEKDLHDFYSWHVEIIPKLKIDAGFEMGTGVVINVVDPDEAAQLLRDTQV